jgi:hypothetical protein
LFHLILIHVSKFQIRSRKNPVPKSTDSIPTHSTDYDSKTESEITDKEKDDMVGLRVIACNKQDGLYYPGESC